MGIFDNVDSIMIHNKEVKSIKTLDGGVLYEQRSYTPMIAEYNNNSITLGYRNGDQWLYTDGDIIIDWGDETTSTVNNPTNLLSHTYTDGKSSHTITFSGKITNLGIGCFFNCKYLTSIILPNAITNTGEHTFYNCTRLTSIIIPDGVTDIGLNCFLNCTGLISVTIPNTVTTLWNGAFSQCTSLTSVTIPNSVTDIKRSCFAVCSGLTNIIIPNSVINLGENCFSSCSSLESVTIPGNAITIESSCFSGCSSLIDYQLYWEDTISKRWSKYDMPNNTNTIFTIPNGTTQLYIDAGYPSNKLVERPPDTLTLTTDKTIIQSNETATITATLSDGTNLSGWTLNYEIKHNNYIISNGSDTTDLNGEIEIAYASNGYGEISITVTDGNLLEETITLWDTIKYDNATSASHNDSIWSTGYQCTFERKSDYTEFITDADQTTGNIYLRPSLSNRMIVDFDYYQGDGSVGIGFFNVFNSSYSGMTWYSLGNLGYSKIGTWIPLRLILDDTTATLLSRDDSTKISTKSYTIDDIPSIIRFVTSNGFTTFRIKNIKTYYYPKITLTSNKNIIQLGESATFTATLSGVPNNNKTLSYVIKHNNTTIDSGTTTTNSNGIATFNYTSTGVKEVEITVTPDDYDLEDSITINDYIFYDSGVDDANKNNNWTITGNPTIVTNDEYTSITTDGATLADVYSSGYPISGDFEMIMEIRPLSTIRFGVVSANSKRKTAMLGSYSQFHLVKMSRVNDVFTTQRSYDNGETWTNIANEANTLTTEDCAAEFYIPVPNGGARTLYHKEIKVYKM